MILLPYKQLHLLRLIGPAKSRQAVKPRRHSIFDGHGLRHGQGLAQILPAEIKCSLADIAVRVRVYQKSQLLLRDGLGLVPANPGGADVNIRLSVAG